MEAGQLDAVRVDVAGTIVEISSDERDALLGKIAFVAGCETIIAKFQAAGACGPVELDNRERNYLRTALDVWELLSELPDGMAHLLDTLAQANPDGNLGLESLDG